MKDLIVIKFGTASITKNNGEPDVEIIDKIAYQVSILSKNYRVVLVSSGAVGAGKQYIKNYDATLSQKKAAAAIGNPLLLNIYAKAFSIYGIYVAQSLCERQHFANRQQFLQLKETYQELWKSNIIPIANENDVVSNRELKFSDNDELATLLATGFGAKKLLLCTQSGGFLDSNLSVLPTIEKIDENILSLVMSTKSTLGLGGMASKLTFTHLAIKMGIEVVIFGMKEENSIIAASENKTGSTFKSQEVNISAKNKWLASGGLSVGKIIVDQGAAAALLKRKSLLTVGIISLEGEFQAGEVVEICGENHVVLAVGVSRLTSEVLHVNLKRQKIVFIHADDIVLL